MEALSDHIYNVFLLQQAGCNKYTVRIITQLIKVGFGHFRKKFISYLNENSALVCLVLYFEWTQPYYLLICIRSEGAAILLRRSQSPVVVC